MRAWSIILGLLFAACGGSGGNGSGGSDRDVFGECTNTGGHTCTGLDEYQTCVESHCDADFKTCLGPNYKSGDFGGGTCTAYIECAVGCGCDNGPCEANCVANQLTADCESCLTAAIGCQQATSCTPPVCH